MSGQDTGATHFRGLIWAILGAVIGAATVWFLQSRSLSLKPDAMSYTDLAAVLLAAVAVIITVFGLVFALAAFWGFGQFRRAAEKTAKSAAKRVATQIAESAVQAHIISMSEEVARQAVAAATRILNADRISALIRERVDAVLFAEPDQALDEEVADYEEPADD